MSDLIKVTSPDGGVSILGADTRSFFERKNIKKEAMNNRRNSSGIKLPLYKIEDYYGEAADESKAKAKRK